MRSCVQRSGGVVLQSETFGAPHLHKSLSRLLAKDDNGELRLGYGVSKRASNLRPLLSA